MTFTTISSWVALLWRALESCGCDAEAVFRAAGLDPAQLQDPNARYPVSAMRRLWAQSVAASGDPCFGLTAAQLWHPTTWHALGYAWMASATLEQAFERLARYARVVSTAVVCQLERRGDEVFVFRLSPCAGAPQVHPTVHEAAIGTLVHMCRVSSGRDLTPRGVWLARSEPPCGQRIRDYFRSPVTFDAPVSGIALDLTRVRARLATANAELAQANEHIVREYLSRLDRTAVAMRVKARMVERLPSGEVSETSIAEALNISQRTLQRKLREEGTSYKQLLEETRRELALQYLDNSQLSINEITYLLGFAEPSTFSRAFKRWEGISPGQYRAVG